MSAAGANQSAFVEKWLTAEPWHRLLLVFEPSATRPVRTLLECIGFELRQAALTLSDPRLVQVKLDWWLQEWAQFAAGSPRHPLTVALPMLADEALVERGQRWVLAAAALAHEDSDADASGLITRWQGFADAQATLSSMWLPGEDAGAATLHALALTAEQLPCTASELERGRLPLPLSILARHGLTRSRLREDGAAAADALADHARALLDFLPDSSGQVTGYRSRQAALASLRLQTTIRTPARTWSGDLRLPPLRALWAAWRGR